MNNFNEYSQVWMYQRPFLRILMESLEVALTICNRELPEFTSAKLFDIMNQIIPTGFVLTTGYWPFYSSNKKQSLCICGRFSLECRHNKHTHHWIDLDPIPNDYTVQFSPGRHGSIQLMPVDISASPVTSPPVGFLVNLQLTFSYQENCRRVETNIAISSRYTLKCEWYPAFHSILFQPNPFFTDFYGFHLRKLLLDREHLTQTPNYNYASLFVETGTMPQFTVVMDRCDLPIYSYPGDYTSAKYNLAPEPTPDVEAQAIFKYSQRIARCRPIWNGQQPQSGLAEISFDMEDFVKQLTSEASAYSEPPPQAIANNNVGVIREQPKPTQIRKRRRKLRYKHVQTFGDTTTTTGRSTYQTNPFPIANLEDPPISVKIANNDQIPTVPQLVELNLEWLDLILQQWN